MALVLYYIKGSPPVGAVLMVAKHLQIKLELREIDFSKEEYLSPWFLKLNPSHTVPTIDDNGFILWDSHAIVCYLAEKYSNNESLYPKDIKERALVNQILSLDCGTVFRKFSDAVKPLFYHGEAVSLKNLETMEESYEILERILERKQFLAGNNLTVADLSIASTLSTMNIVLPVEKNKYPRTFNWLESMKKLPCFEAIVEGLELFKLGYETLSSKHKK